MQINTGKVIDGKAKAQEILAGIQTKVEAFKAHGKRVPGLAVLLIGENPASQVYVANKERSAKSCGFKTKNIKLPAEVSFPEVSRTLAELNQDPTIDGILVQLPLPPQLSQDQVVDCIDPRKDVDGLHPLNQGLLFQNKPVFKPCTPFGVMNLLEGVLGSQLSGLHAVVLGRSTLVGRPLIPLLLEKNCTVSVGHSRTLAPQKLCSQADILIAAVGKPKLVKADWVKSGAILIDVGINREPNGKLCGDIDYDAVYEKCGAITPVPGGVGPMTVAMLMQNTLLARGPA